MHKNTNGETRR